MKEEPPDGIPIIISLNKDSITKCLVMLDYDYSAQQYENYNQYDPDNIKHEYEAEESHFQTEEY